MRLSRTDLLAVLTIVAGGVIGASLSFSFLALSRSDDVPAPDPVVASYESYRSVRRSEEPRANTRFDWRIKSAPDVLEEQQRHLERDRVERIEAAVESVLDRVEEVQRLRDQQERVEEVIDRVNQEIGYTYSRVIRDKIFVPPEDVARVR